MDIILVKDALYIAGAALSLGAILYTWLTGRSKANSAALTKLSQRVDDTASKVLVQQSQIDSLIELHSKIHGEIVTVHKRVDDLVKATSTLGGSVDQMSRQLGLIHEHLLRGGAH